MSAEHDADIDNLNACNTFRARPFPVYALVISQTDIAAGARALSPGESLIDIRRFAYSEVRVYLVLLSADTHKAA